MQTKDPIRILRIITRLNIGGPARQVALLQDGLPELGYQSHVITGAVSNNEKDMGYLFQHHESNVVYLPNLVRSLHPIKDIQAIMAIIKWIRQLKPHIVHTHTSKAGFLGRVAAMLCGVPVIIHTFHGHVFKHYFSPFKEKLFINIERFLAKKTDALVALNHELSEEIQQFGVGRPEQFVTVALGIPLQDYANTPRKNGVFRHKYQLSKAPLIGLVGRLTAIKNIDLLIEVAHQLTQRFSNIQFALIGDGEEKARLQQKIIQLDLQKHFLFTGWIQDLRDVYSDLDALVITSHNEGTPVSLIEAMAAGCPVISTQVGGVGALLNYGEYGRLVAPGSVEGLVQGLTKILQSNTTNDISLKAQQYALAQYSAERLVRNLDHLYQTLLEQKQANRLW